MLKMELSKGWKISLSVILIAIIGLSSTIVVLNLPEGSDIPDPDTAPVLKNLGVTFGNYSEETSQAGSFLFIDNDRIKKIFVEFGEESSGFFGNSWESRTFDFLVAKDSNVYAICDGIVNTIRQPDEGLFEIEIQPTKESHWYAKIGYIGGVSVEVGDTIKAGQIVGKPSTPFKELGRVSIWINYYNPDEDSRNGYYAPFKLFDSELQNEYEAKLWQLMRDWEDFKHNWSIYDQKSMIYAGCLNETMPD